MQPTLDQAAETSRERPPHERGETLSAEQLDERREREALRNILTIKRLDPGLALEVVATYDRSALTEARLEDIRAIASDFGLEFEALEPAVRDELLTLYASIDRLLTEDRKVELAKTMHEMLGEKLMETALGKVDRMRDDLFSAQSLEELQDRYREVMRTIHDLARQMPPEIPRNHQTWEALCAQLRAAIQVKNAEGLRPEAAMAVKGVAAEFEDEIGDEFIIRESQRQTKLGRQVFIEDLTQAIYGRSPQEVEEVKARNREAVVAEMLRLKDEPTVDVDTIQRLHAINNKGIVPKSVSRLRRGHEDVVFGTRMGLLAGDVEPEMEALADRASALVSREMVQGVSGPVYEIAAAKLHNDLLDIHPFSDRNGSTAMLLLELLMSKKGYVPDARRPKSYYGQVRQALDDNPAAIGLILYQQYKIRHQPGYFQGKTIAPEKIPYYEKISETVAERARQRRANEKQGKKAAKKAKGAP